MKRFVCGLALICVGAFFALANVMTVLNAIFSGQLENLVLANRSSLAMEMFALGIILVGGGIILAMYGRRFLQAKRQIETCALQMMQRDNEIDPAKIAQITGIFEGDVRRILAISRAEGAIPQ